MTEQINRREFARKAACSSLALGTMTGTAHSLEPDSVPLVVEQPTPQSPEKLLLEWIRQRYPSEHLTDDVLSEIERDITSQLIRGRRLKAVPLRNGDAPLVFRAYRGEE